MIDQLIRISRHFKAQASVLNERPSIAISLGYRKLECLIYRRLIGQGFWSFSLLILLNYSELARSDSWALGPIVGEGTGLSLSYRVSNFEGMRFTGIVEDAGRVGFEVDRLTYHIPAWLLGSGVEFFSGVGALGEAQRGADEEESYALAVPLGVQWQQTDFPVSVFADYTGLLGPIPLTNLRGRLQLGVHTTF